MKNNTKPKVLTTTILCSTLAAILAIAVAADIPSVMANAGPGGGEDDTGGVSSETETTNSTVVYELIPDDTLLDRPVNEWASKYASQAEYTELTTAMKQYVTGDRPDNAWNDDVVDGHIVLLNFETMVGERGIGLELVALSAKKEMLSGTYSYADPIKTYHNWLFHEYTIPSTTEAIDTRIAEIVENESIRELIPDLVDVYHTMAMRGAVPDALYKENSLYWDRVMGASICDDSPDCNASELLAELHLSPPTQQQLDDLYTFITNNGTDPETGEAYACGYGFIPCADASGSWEKQPRYNSLMAVMTPNSCDDGVGTACTISDHDNGVGRNTVSDHAGDNHAYSTIADIRIRATGHYTTIIEVEGEASLGFDTNYYGPLTWYGDSDIDEEDDSFNTMCSSGGHGGGGCGTYSISGESYGYQYVWVPNN